MTTSVLSTDKTPSDSLIALATLLTDGALKVTVINH
jgi:hypothetical protein